MSDADLRGYFEELTDAEVREAFASGPGAFEPAAWRIIGEQMELRALHGVEAAPEIVHMVEPVRPTVVTSGDELRKRVEEGGTIALVLAVATLVMGTWIVLHVRNGRLLEPRVIVWTTIYVIAGILMRRKHDMWAAGVAALMITASFLLNSAYLARDHAWIFLAGSTFMYSPPVYWLWSAFLSARVLRMNHREAAILRAE